MSGQYKVRGQYGGLVPGCRACKQPMPSHASWCSGHVALVVPLPDYGWCSYCGWSTCDCVAQPWDLEPDICPDDVEPMEPAPSVPSVPGYHHWACAACGGQGLFTEPRLPAGWSYADGGGTLCAMCASPKRIESPLRPNWTTDGQSYFNDTIGMMVLYDPQSHPRFPWVVSENKPGGFVFRHMSHATPRVAMEFAERVARVNNEGERRD